MHDDVAQRVYSFFAHKKAPDRSNTFAKHDAAAQSVYTSRCVYIDEIYAPSRSAARQFVRIQGRKIGLMNFLEERNIVYTRGVFV